MTYIAYEGEGRDGYKDQIVTGVSLHSKIATSTYSNGTSTQCHAYQYPYLFPVLFLYLFPLFIFTCVHVYYTIVSRQLETELTHGP